MQDFAGYFFDILHTVLYVGIPLNAFTRLRSFLYEGIFVVGYGCFYMNQDTQNTKGGKMKRKIRIGIGVVFLLFFVGRIIFVDYPKLFPGDPKVAMAKHLKVLDGDDLAAKAESMTEIMKLSYEKEAQSELAQTTVARVVEERYRASVGGKKRFGAYDFSILVNGAFSLKNLVPHTDKTKAILQEIANDEAGEEIESTFKHLRPFYLEASVKGLNAEMEKMIEQVEETKKSLGILSADPK